MCIRDRRYGILVPGPGLPKGVCKWGWFDTVHVLRLWSGKDHCDEYNRRSIEGPCVEPGPRCKARGSDCLVSSWATSAPRTSVHMARHRICGQAFAEASACLLYTSDAADERSSVDLGGRRIIKKKKMRYLAWNTQIQRNKSN